MSSANPSPPDPAIAHDGEAPVALNWQPEHVETLADGLFFRFERLVFKDQTNTDVLRDVIRHPGGVSVLPIDGDTVTLIRQYRVAIAAALLEAPAGKLEPGEDPVVAARRECVEEVGLEPVSLVSVGGVQSSPGFTDEVIHLFIADGVRHVETAPDGFEEETAEIVTTTLDDALSAVDAGTITDAKTCILLLAADRRRRTHRSFPAPQ